MCSASFPPPLPPRAPRYCRLSHRAAAEYTDHYHRERNHQGWTWPEDGDQPLAPRPCVGSKQRFCSVGYADQSRACTRQGDRDQDQTRCQEGGGLNSARGRVLAGLLPKSVMHGAARLLVAGETRWCRRVPGSWMRGEASAPSDHANSRGGRTRAVLRTCQV
jgi:hypothetical protein